MSYLLLVDFDISKNSSPFDKVPFYLPVKKPKWVREGDHVFIFQKTKEFEGLAGWGYVLGSPMKVTNIPVGHRYKIADRSYIQLPFKFSQVMFSGLIDNTFLFQLPSMNEMGKIRPLNKNTLYPISGVFFREIEYLLHHHWYYFVPCGAPSPSKAHYKVWNHLLREKWAGWYNYRKYKKWIVGHAQCSICGFKHTPYQEFKHDFLELHEIVCVDFNKPYIPIRQQNFRVVCPNCHKLEHEKIKNNP